MNDTMTPFMLVVSRTRWGWGVFSCAFALLFLRRRRRRQPCRSGGFSPWGSRPEPSQKKSTITDKMIAMPSSHMML